jgi:hypothetical protein
MYRTTLKEVFSDKPIKMSMEDVAEFSKPQIYAVRDGDIVFYVGRSVDPFRRIIQHMGCEMQLRSELGQLILDNQPSSDEWIFECYGEKDREPFLRQVIPDSWSEEEKEEMLRICQIDIDSAERYMIRALDSFLNKSRALPAKYTHVRPNASSSQFLGI